MYCEVYGRINDTRKEIRSLKRELNTIRKARRELRALQNKRGKLERALQQEAKEVENETPYREGY